MMAGKQGSAGTAHWNSSIYLAMACASFHHGSLRIVGFLTWWLRIQNIIFYDLLLGRQITPLLADFFSGSSDIPSQVKREGTQTPPEIGVYWGLMAMSSYCHTYYCLSLLLTAFQSHQIPFCSKNTPPNPKLKSFPTFRTPWGKLSSPRWLHDWLFRVWTIYSLSIHRMTLKRCCQWWSPDSPFQR